MALASETGTGIVKNYKKGLVSIKQYCKECRMQIV